MPKPPKIPIGPWYVWLLLILAAVIVLSLVSGINVRVWNWQRQGIFQRGDGNDAKQIWPWQRKDEETKPAEPADEQTFPPKRRRPIFKDETEEGKHNAGNLDHDHGSGNAAADRLQQDED